ncbi:uncharacterized protein LOC133791939 [Humulus lupulus]|uniref:uncharacterized protein LOC133791939 n=1 Tax=Humulus lupulus TaxID=3486 RepID=UPI002B4163FD|nr:uncharacterized protein LOC133791939 [Humulus lupulus]
MEYLTRSLQSEARSPYFRFHPMCKGLKLINLCFADDVILFCKGSVAAISVLKDSLKKFSEASGLSINSKKSQVYFGGVAAGVRTEILQVLNLSAGSFPLHYLGVPLRPTKWKHTDCRLLLIQTVLSGLRNYWMSVFTLPQSIIKEVEKLCWQFLWGALGTRCKFHLASWNQVCLPKAYGGLGTRDGTSWNRALLARYIWAVSTKQDSLWVKWIQHVYLKGVNFWDYALKHDSNWYWRKLCHLRNRFSEREILAAETTWPSVPFPLTAFYALSVKINGRVTAISSSTATCQRRFCIAFSHGWVFVRGLPVLGLDRGSQPQPEKQNEHDHKYDSCSCCLSNLEE